MRPSRTPENPLTPASVADWEARTFTALRKHREMSASTTVDDELPEDPQDHMDEVRSNPNLPK